MKQETLEEAAEREFPLMDTEQCKTGAAEEENLHLLGHRRSFIKGAKWQQERILKFILDEDNHTEGELGNSCIDVQTLVYFIEQFKKK